jgi:hypothetical protein
MNVPQHKSAFVIRFHINPELGEEWFEGRVEHVESGQLTHFYSRSELTTFMERVLKEVSVEEYRLVRAMLVDSQPTLRLPRIDIGLESRK